MTIVAREVKKLAQTEALLQVRPLPNSLSTKLSNEPSH